MINIYHLLLIIVFFSTVSCTSKSERSLRHHSETSLKNKELLYVVTKVVDGDTFWIDNKTDKGLKIRLIGINAPESRNVFKKKKQAYGEESKNYLKSLLEGQSVRLEFDVDFLDQFNRTLAYAYLENGEMINELLVKTGNAQIMTIAPNIKYEHLFIAAQEYARENAKGLWGLEITE